MANVFRLLGIGILVICLVFLTVGTSVDVGHWFATNHNPTFGAYMGFFTFACWGAILTSLGVLGYKKSKTNKRRSRLGFTEE